MFVDQVDESCLIPLNEAIDATRGRLEMANSTPAHSLTFVKLINSAGSLSEMAVLGKPAESRGDVRLIISGFEVGMSWASPKLLPIWEAQVSQTRVSLLTVVRRLHERRSKHDRHHCRWRAR